LSRTREQLEYHATQQRKYRQEAKREKEKALANLAAAAATLLKAGYTPGELLDLILAIES
jgi:hypothetical protein